MTQPSLEQLHRLSVNSRLAVVANVAFVPALFLLAGGFVFALVPEAFEWWGVLGLLALLLIGVGAREVEDRLQKRRFVKMAVSAGYDDSRAQRFLRDYDWDFDRELTADEKAAMK